MQKIYQQRGTRLQQDKKLDVVIIKLSMIETNNIKKLNVMFAKDIITFFEDIYENTKNHRDKIMKKTLETFVIVTTVKFLC